MRGATSRQRVDTGLGWGTLRNSCRRTRSAGREGGRSDATLPAAVRLHASGVGALAKHPENRFDAVRELVGKLGGRTVAAYLWGIPTVCPTESMPF